MSRAIRSNANAFSTRAFVCATHHGPATSRTDRTPGGLIGGLSEGLRIGMGGSGRVGGGRVRLPPDRSGGYARRRHDAGPLV